ncbi:MAG: Ig-like domain-containing protein, partial [Myxococcota bacterium]
EGGNARFDPYGCKSIPNAIVYTFPDEYLGSGTYVRDVCETAAQEIAHAFTLDHQMLCEDPMTYLSGCGAKTFQDQYATCGEYEPRECTCNGTSQNSVQLLYERLGTADGSPPPAPPSDGELPVVELVSPNADAILPANSIIEVVATASDDVGLVAVELLWPFSGESMPCPGEGGAWACARSDETYTWQIRVGAGARTFRVRARDVVGNVVNSEERSMWLSLDGNGPPEDNYAPEVRIVAPREGVSLPESSTMEVVATASDDTGLSSVVLVWDWRDVVLPCPYDDGRNRCEVNGSTYTWSVRVREGERTFSVRATDLVGKVSETAKRTVQLTTTPTGDRPLENDTWDLAAPLSCGESRTLEALPGEEDWFDIEGVVEGEQVIVEVSGDVAENLDIEAATGPHSSDVFADAEGDPALTFEPPASSEDDVRVRVRPVSRTGSYTIRVDCVLPVADIVATTDDVKLLSCSGTERTSGTLPWREAALLAASLFWGGSSARRRLRRRN